MDVSMLVQVSNKESMIEEGDAFHTYVFTLPT